MDRNGTSKRGYFIHAVLLWLVLVTPVTLNAATSTTGFWCGTLGFITIPLGFCEEPEVIVVETTPEPPPPAPPTPPPPTVRVVSVPEPVASPTTPAPTIVRETPTYVTNPTTIIREVIQETVRDSGGNNNFNEDDFVSRTLFDGQVDATYDSLGNSIDGLSDSLAEAVSTGVLTVSGNGTVGGTFGVTGALSAATSTLSALTVTNDTTLSGSLTLAALGGGVLTTDSAGLVSTTTVGAASITADSLDFAQFADSMTVDATTLFDLDTNGADLNFDSNTLFIDSSANRIGIGTNGPGYTFEVNNGVLGGIGGTPVANFRATDGGTAFLQSQNTEGAWKFGIDGFENFILSDTANDILTIEDGASANSFYLTSAGNIGMGTSSAGARLTVQTGGTTDIFNAFEAGGQEVFTILESGNVGIGTTNPSSFKLQVAGNVGPNADNTYTLGAVGSDWECLYYEGGSLGTCASDERLKENISVLSFDTSDASALQKVAGLTLHTFNFKEAPDSPYKGLIAQEVLEVAPELVTEGSNGFLAVKYGDIQWLILEAVQDMWSIVKGFAESFTSKRIVAEDELCVGGTCVNEADLKAFLEESGRSSNPSASAETGGGDDVQEDGSNDEGNDQTNSEDDSTDTATTTATTTSPQVDDTASSSPATDEAVADDDASTDPEPEAESADEETLVE